MKKWLSMVTMGMLLMTACSSGGGDEAEISNQTATNEGKTVVTWSVQTQSALYQTAEKKFEEKYPDIDLQLKWTEDYEQYQKTTNTEILAGKGPDIFEVSRLPIDDYKSQNLLLNLEERMEQDSTLNKDNLQMNILNAIKSDDGLYAIPFGFYLRAFVGDGEMLGKVSIDDANWTWEEFGEIAKELGESGEGSRYAMANNPPDFLLQEMLVDRYAEFVDTVAKKANFDTPLFINTLQQIKKMYDDQVMTSEPADTGKQMFYSTVLQSPASFITDLYSYISDPILLHKPEQTGGARIVTASSFAIQANSPVKEEAWKFIAFMLSEEGQSLQDRDGFSLLKSVNKQQLDDIQEQVKSGTFKLPDGKTAQVSEDEFPKFKQFMDTANNYSDAEGKVISIAGEEVLAYFSGQKSAEEVAELIQNRVTTYLNE